ncbi:MAG: type II secretion system F family protein [Planctomycetes bacterium]|nr:type II secretion system F family protein [Planctomycetota bacterium]
MLLLLSALMLGCAVFLVLPPIHAFVSRKVARLEDEMSVFLSELFIFHTTPRSITIAMAVLTVFLILFLGIVLNPLFSVPIGIVAGIGVPMIVLHFMVVRRRAALEKQLMDGLITVANGVRAGLNLPQAMRLIEEHGKPPLSQEFGLVLREVEHGTSLDVALENAGRRIKSHNFRLLFAALKTTRMRGGNIPETLDRLSESLREITRLEEKIKAQTAQGKTSAIFMAVMPLVVLLIYGLIDPDGVGLLFRTIYGQAVLAVVLILDLTGFFWIRSIINFEY